MKILGKCPKCNCSIETENERDIICPTCKITVHWQGSTPWIEEPKMVTIRQLITNLLNYPMNAYAYTYEDCIVIVNGNTYKHTDIGTINTPEAWRNEREDEE